MLNVGSGGNQAATQQELSSAMSGMRSGGTPMADPFAMVQPVRYITPEEEVTLLDDMSNMPPELQGAEAYGPEPIDTTAPAIPEEVIQPGMEQQPVDPVQQPANQPRGRRPFKMDVSAPEFNQNYRYTQQDFYGQQRPISTTDAVGGALHFPQAGQLPMAIWASRMQQHQKRKAEVQERIKQLRDLEVEPTADPYQQSFAKTVGSAKDSFVKALAESYDGDESKAWMEIGTDGTDANRKWLQLHRDMEALGQYGKFLWADAKDYRNQAKNNEIYYTPETLKLAEDFYYGLGNFRGDEGIGDIHQLTKNAERLSQRISIEQFAQKQLLPGIKDRYARFQEAKFYIDPNTGLRVEQTNKKYDANTFLEQEARNYARMNPMVSEAEALDIFKKIIPPEHFEINLDSKMPSGSGGDGGGGTAGGGISLGFDYRKTGLYDKATGKTVAGAQSLHFTPFQETGGKQYPVKEMQVSTGGTTTTRPMRDVQLVYAPEQGKWRLVGKMLDEGSVEKLNNLISTTQFDVSSKSGADALGVQKEVDRVVDEFWRKNAKYSAADADANTSVLEMYWRSGNPDQMVVNELRRKGSRMTVEDVQQKLRTKGGRDEIARILGANIESGQPAQGAPAPATNASDPLGILD